MFDTLVSGGQINEADRLHAGRRCRCLGPVPAPKGLAPRITTADSVAGTGVRMTMRVHLVEPNNKRRTSRTGSTSSTCSRKPSSTRSAIRSCRTSLPTRRKPGAGIQAISGYPGVQREAAGNAEAVLGTRQGHDGHSEPAGQAAGVGEQADHRHERCAAAARELPELLNKVLSGKAPPIRHRRPVPAGAGTDSQSAVPSDGFGLGDQHAGLEWKKKIE